MLNPDMMSLINDGEIGYKPPKPKTINNAEKLVAWIKAHDGKLPQALSKVHNEESILGNYLSSIRSKVNKSNFNSESIKYIKANLGEEIFTMYRYTNHNNPDVMDTAKKLVDWIECHQGRYPIKECELEQASLAMYLANIKAKYWHDPTYEPDVIAYLKDKLGEYSVERINRKNMAIDNAHKLLKFVEDNGHLPTCSKTDTNEKLLYNFRYRYIRSFKDPRTKNYPEVTEFLLKNNLITTEDMVKLPEVKFNITPIIDGNEVKYNISNISTYVDKKGNMQAIIKISIKSN